MREWPTKNGRATDFFGWIGSSFRFLHSRVGDSVTSLLLADMVKRGEVVLSDPVMARLAVGHSYRLSLAPNMNLHGSV